MSDHHLPAVPVDRIRTVMHFVWAIVGVVVVCTAAWEWGPTRHVASILLQSTAVLALVIGLAVQGTLTNVVAGLVISAAQPIQVGDTVTIGEHTGRVARLGVSYTRIEIADGSHVEFPNTLLAQHEIVVQHRSRPPHTGDGREPTT